ncbi:hypothetical protein FUT69_04700 [Xylella taiwanensis]|nr:hypothetical protein [Xylella taiwanensis]
MLAAILAHPDTYHPVMPSTPTGWCLVPGAWCLVPGAWCLVPGAWCLVPGATKIIDAEIVLHR